MHPTATLHTSAPRPRGLSEPPAVRWALIALALLFLGAFVALPIAAVFAHALQDGLAAYVAALAAPDALAAMKLTLLAAAVSVPLNLVFGLAAAWLIARFRFPGKAALTTLIDLPFSISPVIAGLLFVLLFGRTGWLGPWLSERGLQIIFAPPGIVLATVFVTFPFVAREVLPVLQAQGVDEEEAALTMGASGWQVFFRVSLPKVKWALLYGLILANARAMGEFGAVSVVSGHVRGLTNTVPLHVEILYNEYAFSAAFAVASSLTLLALATLGIKQFAEWRTRAALRFAAADREPGLAAPGRVPPQVVRREVWASEREQP